MKKIFLIVGLLGLSSCGPPVNGVHHVYIKSFVVQYYSLSGIEAIFWGNEASEGKEVYIELRVIPDEYVYGVFSDDHDSKARYEALCVLHGDVSYNRTIIVGGSNPKPMPNVFQDRDYISIVISSDQDWDEAHPAGTSLNDVFYFASSSPIKYIARGYIDPYDWDLPSLPEYYANYLHHANIDTVIDGSVTDGNEPVYGITADLTARDLTLLGGTTGWYLTLAVLTPVAEPTLSKEHNIRIALTDTAGNELVAQVAATFTAGFE